MTRRHPLRLARNVVLFGLVGLVFSLAVAGLANVAPSAFGWLTLPFWVLPAIANFGAHDVGWPFFLLSGSICYGVVAFLVFQLRVQHMHRRAKETTQIPQK